ncbi:phosphoacetylglucosamine mutase [Sphaeroforma arctica JP610]|uniref:Phosphoacetylglucosamine mutase n=1 Tax=Sphaeroforma arctica JP610 TaxID=667725 RepID=A0A0L0FZ62_9EUKA|nr:phosphoacetylglucosamine mutase [Sphaeroforma arctica JP610]KNC82100.1 phosphoacetylglucosamine mutase [Sphaeroforma arctica JP610]|eukprot:XP_014156002.1 phosphoacetylglucosamine mutase [Sphaeroforma arctica JP610]
MSDAALKRCDEVGSSKHPLKDVKFSYGTAGFRTKANTLDPIMYRVGLMAALRSVKFKGQYIGVMVTASHNPVCDNGVKIVDPYGDMMEEKWESYATTLANAPNGELAATLQDIAKALDLNLEDISKAKVIYGYDTRPSCPELVASLVDGFNAIGVEVCKDLGVVTTPQLHFVTRCLNDPSYGEATLEGYYRKIAEAFKKIQGPGKGPEVVLDGANGVGAPRTNDFKKYVGKAFNVTIVNDASHKDDVLNDSCGADFVKVQQKAPNNVTPTHGVHYVSFDGDADRVMYYFFDKDMKFHMLDGDKIATLIGGYLAELVKDAGHSLNLGVVQTAYANGSSTAYLENEMKVPIACTPTGVKHLHHAAKDFDIGVYFEANGHGTVIFDSKVEKKIRDTDASKLSASQQEKHALLLNVIDLINQTVGDALSDALMVEVVLKQKNWTCEDWDACYTDLPNRQLKVSVKDRTAVQVTNAERQTTAPAGLQEAVDEAVAKYSKGRSFVRPSGTEDVVRVYAEAETRELCDQLAYEVAQITHRIAGGIGEAPSQ